MSDPIILSAGAASAIAGGVVAIVGALWIQVRSQIGDLRKQLSDAVDHIRQLEQDRAADLKTAADRYLTLAERVVTALQENTRAQRDTLAVLRQRRCLLDEPHANLPPGGDTTALIRRMPDHA